MSRICKVCSTVFEGRRCVECHKRISREYAAKNREQVRLKAVEFRRNNAEKIRAYQAARRLVDGAKIAAQKAAYSAANPGKAVDRVREWRRANPEAKRALDHNYRARSAGKGKLSRDLALRLLEKQKGTCACCWRSLEDGYHMDHITPLAKGGLNVDENIQLLTPLCNGRKHANSMADYEAQYGEENGYGLV